MLHIYPTLREVKEFNEDIQNYSVNPNDQIHEATHWFSHLNVIVFGQTVSDNLIPPNDRQGGKLSRWLSISLWSSLRVICMLLWNICTKKLLINCGMGFVTGFEIIDSYLSAI